MRSGFVLKTERELTVTELAGRARRARRAEPAGIGWQLILAGILLATTGGCARAPAVLPEPEPPPGSLTATRFLAYGDNITEGLVIGCPGSATSAVRSRGDGLQLMPAAGRGQPSPVAYPAVLQDLLRDRYRDQSPVVLNEGSSGEDIEAGKADLPRVLTEHQPEALLLQEGIITINTRHAEGIPVVADGLRQMVRAARQRGIVVFVGTLLPQRPGGCRAFADAGGKDDIVLANVQIREMVGAEGAHLVDLYQTFNGQTSLLLGEDGMHPSAAGYRAIAETFLAAIRKYLESDADDEPRRR